MKTLCYILLSLLFPVNILFAMPSINPENAALLRELDKVISRKSVYHARKQKEIDSLEKRFVTSLSFEQRDELYKSLYKTYLHFQADSALQYLFQREKLLERYPSTESANDLQISKAEVFGIMGLYIEAFKQLENINPHELDSASLLYYYYTGRTYYGWLADYTNTKEKKQYEAITNTYRDSILGLAKGPDYNIVLADKLIVNGQPDSAIVISEKELKNPTSCVNRSYLYYNMSLAYEQKGDTDNEIKYLALTAMNDLKMPVREYISLQKLALLMYKLGDIDRAYKYLSCALEDAVACNARLRSIEVTEFFPIIDKAYKLKQQKERNIIRISLLIVSILTLLLLISIFYLQRQMKKLSAVRKKLSLTNSQLQYTNQELNQTSKIKEEYIALYLNQCIVYLDKLETYRRSLARLAMASKTEELFKTIKSSQFISDERKNFYNEFDKSFIRLFPHFIESFNKLMTPEGQILPKSGEILTTELRIFALIRLGINNAASIAHFLGCSLATVYSYRSKVKSKAIDKDNFEELVASI